MAELRQEVLEKRSRVLMALLALVFFTLVGRLGYLQMAQANKWQSLSQGQRIRLVAIPAPRGQILDREGNVLATNQPAFTASLVYTGEPLPDEAVKRLARILTMEPATIRKAAEQLMPASGRPYQPVPLKVNISDKEHALLEEQRADLPGVVVEVQPIRVYPGFEPAVFTQGGRLAAHVLGQVKRGDRGPAAVGADGVELAYNGSPEANDGRLLGLQGRDGIRQVEVDAQGRPSRVIRQESPIPGNNLVLTLDARLQAVAEKALLDRMEYLRQLRSKDCPNGCAAEYAAAVAIDVRTGDVLAMASVPAYNPNDFALRTYAMPGTPESKRWQQAWQALQEDVGKPLLNHATMDAAPPGSTFKPVTAVAALEAKVTTPTDRVACPGYRQVGNRRFKDWKAHGSTNLEQALGRSCDVYFYEMGSRMKIQTLVEMAGQFGLGKKTGIEERDGIQEIAGWVAGPETKKARHPEDPTWYRSQNLSVSIGQDDNQFTPLQMANFTAALANGGTLYRPRVVKGLTGPDGRVLLNFQPEVISRVKASPKTLAEVRKGMLAVTQYNPTWRGVDNNYGTSAHLFTDFTQRAREATGREIKVGAKTGTAETGRKDEAAFGWFTAFAPYDKPEIAIAVFVRHGGGGSLAAGPVARAILDEYFGLNKPKVQGPPLPKKRQAQPNPSTAVRRG